MAFNSSGMLAADPYLSRHSWITFLQFSTISNKSVHSSSLSDEVAEESWVVRDCNLGSVLEESTRVLWAININLDLMLL